MLKGFSLLLFCGLAGLLSFAQQPPYNFKKLNANLEYAFIVNRPTSQSPKEGDQISVNMTMVSNDKLLFSSWQSNKGKPSVYGVAKPIFKGDVIEVISLMTVGDSVVCRCDADALFKNTKTNRPNFIKSGDKIYYFIKLVSIKTKEQLQKEQSDAINKQIQDQMAKQKAAAEKQAVADEKLLKAYFAKKNINPTKTSSGLYYQINTEVNGVQPLPGDTVVMSYTGTLMDGTKFDSNEDTAFHHPQPYEFVLGRGVVIRGWDEGIALLKQGSKATFFIPSGLAYGPQPRPGTPENKKGIPANSILIFDVQLVNVKHFQAKAEQPLKDSTNAASPVLKQ